MSDYITNVKLAELAKSVGEIKTGFEEIKSFIRSHGDLWDGSDIVKYWHVSDRTLASWRKKKLIGYILNKKIYYPKQLRDKFLDDNYVKKEV